MVSALLAAAFLAVPAHNRPVPVLMYHVLSPPPIRAGYPDLFVRPQDFAAQMNWLARRGYQAVTLQRVYDYWETGAALPARPVVVSFDDGYLSQYTRGYTTLRAHRWPAVVNLEVNFLQPVGGLRPWRVRNLIAAGWEIDAHTLTHPDLTTLDDKRLWNEVDGSRKALQRTFHVPVNFFCYPAGRFDARVIRAVKLAGYRAATTTQYGLARPTDLFTLDRIRINGSDGLRGFAAKLDALTRSAY